MNPFRIFRCFFATFLIILLRTNGGELVSSNYRITVFDFVALDETANSSSAQLFGAIVGDPVGSTSSGKAQLEVGFWAAAQNPNDRIAGSLTLDNTLDQTVVHGDVDEFFVSAPNLRGPVRFELRYDAETAGVFHSKIDFHATTPGDAYFRYEPGPEDLEPFNVTIVATGADGQQDTSQFTIAPYPALPPEEDLIQSTLAEPAPDSPDYAATTSELTDTPEDFNGVSQKTRKVSWVGKSLIVQQGHLPEVVIGNDQPEPRFQNVKYLSIFAESVTIREPVRLPGATVMVYTRNFSAPGLDKPFGDAANVTIVTNAVDWLQPESLRLIISHLRDGYLNAFSSQRIGSVRTQVREYLEQINIVQNSPRWIALSDASRNEFEQLKGELEGMNWSLDRNLDFFGNPAGWTPNLSFEVNLTFFNTEIEQAIKTLYLTQWLLNVADSIQSRIAGMKQSQATLFAEVQSADTELGSLKVRLPDLQSRSQKISDELEALKAQIVLREEELQREAEAAAHAKKKKKGWKKIAGVVGSVMKVFPVGQPILGAVGQGLSIVSQLDKHSFSNPLALLNTIQSFQGPASAFTAANFASSISQTKNVLDGIIAPLNPSSVLPPKIPFEPGFMDYVDKVKTYYSGVKGSVDTVRSNIRDILNAVKTTGMSDSDAQTLVAQQRALNPEFNAPIRTPDGRLNGLLDEVQNKISEQSNLANEITEAIQKMGQLTDQISRDILAIDALNQSLARANGSLDPRSATALTDLARRAQQRLLKYHYFLAKSYEARFQEPYNSPLDLSRLFDQLAQLAKSDPKGSGTLTRDQVTALAQIYSEAVANVVARIVDRFNQDGPGARTTGSLRLSAKELDALNLQKPLTINFVDRQIVPRDREGIEINNVTITMKVGGNRRPNETVRLRLDHSGVSKFKRGEKNWLFRNSNISSGSPFRREHPFHWELDLDTNTEKFNPTQPSLGDTSLLTRLLTLAGKPINADNLLLFSRAGLWADLTLSRADSPDILSHYTIEDVLIEIDYDYRNQSRSFSVLDVAVTDNAALRPLIVLNHPDVAGRQHGINRITRTFDRGGVVDVSVPVQIGSWTFKEWTGFGGVGLPPMVASQAKNRKLTIAMDNNLALQAVYVTSDADEDGLPDDWELSRFGNLLSSGAGDADRDGINNYVEFFEGTNPVNPDSDGDGFSDRDEIRLGTNPNSASSIPFALRSVESFGPGTILVRWEVYAPLPDPVLLEASYQLDSQSWQTIGSERFGARDTLLEATSGARFFRLRLPE